MKIPFTGPSYESFSPNADDQRAVNCYVELDANSPRAPAGLVGTPGTVYVGALPAAPIRAFIQFDPYVLVIAGEKVYRITSDATATLLGSIATTEGHVSMATNGLEVLIVDGVRGWLATPTTFAVISDADFPNGVTSAAFCSSFFLVGGDGSQQFYWNETPNVGADWNGLDFASAEGNPDPIICLQATQLEVWILGTKTTEIWGLSGNADSPFTRSGNAFIEQGAACAAAAAKLDSTVFWLGRDERGTGIVWRANGYTPTRISNHSIERWLQGVGDLSAAIAFTYQQDGHGFYVLTAGDRTFVYDVSTNMWHERMWRDPSTNEEHRWRANCHIYAFDGHYVGDFENGNLYRLDMDYYKDADDPIKRIRRTQCMDSPDGERLFYSSLQVDMQTGVGLDTGQGAAPLLMLRYSNDGGHTWSNEKTASIGAEGEYGARAMFRRLGMGRNRVWEISMTDSVKFAVLGAYCKLEKGED